LSLKKKKINRSLSREGSEKKGNKVKEANGEPEFDTILSDNLAS
jgi:hypothetical protein